MTELERRVEAAIGTAWMEMGDVDCEIFARAALKAHAEWLKEQGKMIADNPSAQFARQLKAQADLTAAQQEDQHHTESETTGD